MWLHVAVNVLVTTAVWVYYAAVNPTVGAAVVAGVTSVVNTFILVRHERTMNRRLDERRLIVVKQEDGVTVTDEERRSLERDQ